MLLVTRFSWSEMMERIEQDVHPPFYYIIFRLWINCFGDNEIVGRLFSVNFGVLSVYIAFLFTRDAYSSDMKHQEPARMAGLMAACFTALTCYQIRWSQEIRMYSLGVFLALLSCWVLVRALQNKTVSYRWWILYVVTAVAMLYTHNYSIFTIVSQLFCCTVYLLISKHDVRFQLKATIAAYCSIAILFLPWLPVLWRQHNQVHNNYWIKTFDIWTLPVCFYELFIPEITSNSPSKIGMAVVTLTVIGITGGLVKRFHPGIFLSMVVFLGPIVLAALVSISITPIISSRYFLFAQPFLFCGTAIYIAQKKTLSLKIAICLLIIFNLLYIHIRFNESYAAELRPGFKGIVSRILSNQESNSLIIVGDYYSFPCVKYYAGRSSTVVLIGSEKCNNHFNGKPILITADFELPPGFDQSKYSRLWIVTPPDEIGWHGRIIFDDFVILFDRKEQEVFWQNYSSSSSPVEAFRCDLVPLD